MTAARTGVHAVTYARFETKLGVAIIACSDQRIAGFYFEGQKHFKGPQPDWRYDESASALRTLRAQYRQYERGELRAFDLPIHFAGTDFQQRVWRALLEIPFGQTRSYSELASAIGAATAVRAVGAAVGRNPISVIVPCHRVLGASGALTGYAGGLARKQALLRHEGALPADSS